MGLRGGGRGIRWRSCGRGWCELLFRVLAFDVGTESGGGIGLGFGLFWFPGGMKAAGAVVAAVFDVVGFGERRDHGGASVNLADAVENDFGAAVVHLHGAVDFDNAAFEAA